jgi:hypothetical protein
MRENEKDWLRYIWTRVKGYWALILEISVCVALLEWLGYHEVTILLGGMVVAFILGAETMLGLLRDYCLKHNINPETLKYDDYKVNKGDKSN